MTKIWLLGESHHKKEHLEQEVRFIMEKNPAVVLHEKLGGFTYFPESNRQKWQKGRIKCELFCDEPVHLPSNIGREVLTVCQEKNLTIIGCDATDEELDQAMQVEYPKLYEEDGFANHFLPEACVIRDRYMTQVIKESYKTHGSMVVILGDNHAKRIHKEGFIKELPYEYVELDSLQ